MNSSSKIRMIAGAILAAVLLLPVPAYADAIMRSQAMFAETIAEIYVNEDELVLELEIGMDDIPAFRNLLPDEIYKELGYGDQAIAERLQLFFERDIIFKTNGETALGFLALPDGDGPFPGIIVVQEWWGIDDHIKDVAQRFAREGFAAFAPDLYHGKATSEPGEAQKLMMGLDMNRASRELVAAAEDLSGQSFIGGGVGATGF